MTKTDNVAGQGMRAEISDLLIILNAPPQNAPELLFFSGLLNSTWIQPTGNRQIQECGRSGVQILVLASPSGTLLIQLQTEGTG